MTATIIIGRFEYHEPTRLPPPPTAAFTKVFEGRSGVDFSPINEAQGYLAAHGFAFGPSCVSNKIGVMFGREWRIAKWRNLTPLEQRQCHGLIEGDRRLGPVTFKLFFSAPAFAFAALGTPEQADAILKAWSDQR